MKNSTALIILVISVGLFYSFTIPQYHKLQALRGEAIQYKDILANVTALSEKRDDLLTVYQKIPKTQIAEIDEVLPDNIDIVGLARDLDLIAGKYGISIKNIHTKDQSNSGITAVVAAPTTAYEKTTVSIGFITNYDNFKKFLNDIEHSRRIVDVRAVSFQSSDNGLYQYQMTLDTYSLK